MKKFWKFWIILENKEWLFNENKWFMVYSESENFWFLTMSKEKMGHILPKWKNATTDFFEYSIVSDYLPENW